MTERPEIALATPADRDVVLPLFSAQLAEHGIAPPGGPAALARAVQAVLDGSAPGFCLVARVDDRGVGVAYVSLIWSLEHAGLSAWLDELYVLPEARNRGIGTKVRCIRK